VRENLAKTGRGYVQCSCQSTRVWQRHRTRRHFCDGPAKPELIDSCTIRSYVLYVVSPCFCRMKNFVAHVDILDALLLDLFAITFELAHILLRF